MNKSKQVFSKLSQITQDQLISIINDNGTTSYNNFKDFILRIIKPIALDLKNALITIPNPSVKELNLISRLEELFQKTIETQTKLKEKPNLKIREHLEILLKMINKIEIVALKVVSDEIEKCL